MFKGLHVNRLPGISVSPCSYEQVSLIGDHELVTCAQKGFLRLVGLCFTAAML